MSTNNTVLLIADYHQILVDELTAVGYSVINVPAEDENLYEEIAAAVGIITSNALKIDKSIIDHAANLCFIGRLGSGMEIIDTEYASSKGIICYSSPEGNANAVAEHCLGMLLSILHKQASSNAELRQGIYLRRENTGFELQNQSVGIIGFGNNGSLFAEKLALLGATVYAYDKYKTVESTHSSIVAVAAVKDLQAKCSVISLHLPASEETLNYITDDFISEMKSPFIFINCARGKLVATETLLKGLKSGKIISAGLDVYEREPLFQQSSQYNLNIAKVLAMPQVVATPHIAGYTFDATFKMSAILARKILAGKHI